MIPAHDDYDGPLLSIINKKAHHSNNMTCPWLSYDNEKAMWRNSGKICFRIYHIVL